MSLGYQSFYQTQLTSNIDDTVLTIPVDTAPIPDEGYLVIESTVSAKREIIYYTSKTASSVICPAGGRGYDGTTAVSHLQGAAVIMAPVAAMFEALTDLFTTTPQGWTSLVPAVSSVTNNGNRSYDITFASTVASILSSGMRLRTTRTVAAPTQCTSLNGTTQYWSKASPNKLTFTNNFVLSGWVKMASYGATGLIVSRLSGAGGGFSLRIETDGRVGIYGYNGGTVNYRGFLSYQSIPLNKWVHVTAQLDMTVTTNTPTTNYIMLDGKDIPAVSTQAGTNPTSLTQAGNLEIGSNNGGTGLFPGKIAQVAIYNAKVTQATILASINQGLSGSETSLASAYSFNGVATDLNTTTPNDLTASGSATATNADSPYGNAAASSTLDYALVMSVSGSTATVQVPEGCTIPTSGGVTSVAYSVQGNPFGWVSDKGRWELLSLLKTLVNTTSNATYGAFNSGGWSLFVPGAAGWTVGWIAGSLFNAATTGVVFNVSPVVLTGLGVSATNNELSIRIQSPTAVAMVLSGATSHNYTQTANSTYVMYTVGATTAGGIDGANYQAKITALPSGL